MTLHVTYTVHTGILMAKHRIGLNGLTPCLGNHPPPSACALEDRKLKFVLVAYTVHSFNNGKHGVGPEADPLWAVNLMTKLKFGTVMHRVQFTQLYQ